MDEAVRAEWWANLPAGIREQIDGYVLQDSLLRAVKLILDIGRFPDGMDINSAQQIAVDRYRHFGDRIARTPDSPLDLESLARRAAGCPGRIVAIEAIWDGDTVHDWFVLLLAITADPGGEHAMAAIYHSTAKRYLGEDVAAGRPHPSAAAAER
ncbi:hypothetical protein ACFQ07_05780, partial [Actinomadura adrarensis]